MTALLSGTRSVRTSATLVLLGAMLSGPMAMLIVGLVEPQPEWTGLTAFCDSYHPVQVLPYVLGYILLAGFVFFSASCHALAPTSMRPRTAAALMFTGVYAALIFTNYTIQLGFIPRMLQDRPSYLEALTMANPASFAWFLEMFGYGAMGVATWLVAPLFGGGPRSVLIRYLLIANGVVSIVGAACTALIDRFVFTPAGLVSFAAWNLLIVVCYLLIALTPDGGLETAAGPAGRDQ